MGQFDYMLLGLLVYEMATRKRPLADMYSLSTVVLAVVILRVVPMTLLAL